MDVKNIYTSRFTSLDKLCRQFGFFDAWCNNGYCNTEIIKYKTKDCGKSIFYYFDTQTGNSYTKPNTDEDFRHNGLTMHSKIKFIRNEVDILSIYDKGD